MEICISGREVSVITDTDTAWMQPGAKKRQQPLEVKEASDGFCPGASTGTSPADILILVL